MPRVELREIRDDNGHRIGEAEFVDGKPHGRSRLWSVGGVLIEESHFLNGEYDGSYKTWWNNGKPKEAGAFANGKRIGVYRWFSESGHLVQEHNYGAAL
jgi:antitoxin component YwqK of YwqJK toxin-antitoxin module